MNVELQVIGSALRAVAEEMGAVLIRSAFSANIKERRDCSTAIFDESRPDDRAGRAHPRPPRRDAGRRRCRHVPVPGTGTGLHAQRPVHRRHAPAGHHARLAHVARLRGVACAPRRRRRHGAREPARVLARALPGRADHPADAAHRRGRASCLPRTRATPTSGAATCARRSPRIASPSGASTSSATRRGRERIAAAMDELYAYSERHRARRDRAAARRHVEAEDVVEAVEAS